MTLSPETIEAMTNTALRIALGHLKDGNIEFAEDHLREIITVRLGAQHDTLQNLFPRR